ncbi:MAG: HAD-IIIC family phosphatase [Bacteroidales bacterium]|nr:HAD-IIIC family phosphatase [Bacteroidales bacterium]MCF8456085.1 HAD-IIIC family phosphatase [Bacteroidales bacterium]
MTFNELLQKASEIKGSATDHRYKLAVLGNFATQFLVKALEASGLINGIELSVYEAGYDQIENEIINPASEIYTFSPDSILVCYSSRKLRSKFYELGEDQKSNFAGEFLNKVEELTEIIGSRLSSKILFCNIEELNDNVFGNFSSSTRLSFLNQARRLNVGLMDLAERKANLFIVDVQDLLVQQGQAAAWSPSLYINADLVYSLDFTVVIVNQVVKIIQTLLGKFKKCLILDLDNTLWGGIIGDDGMEGIEIGSLGIGKAFTDFQKWVKALMRRGIILAVCSKNEEVTAKDAFRKHPEMVLRLDDFAVFIANWNNKADNIREIKEILNIGFDSMVFIDDNPVEREIVSTTIPEIMVPDLPDDPAEYLQFLISLNMFETVSYSGNDAARTKQYQEESKRRMFSNQFTDVTAFLDKLEMKSLVRKFTPFDVQRVSQLSQRSNQFNLRTVRYTASDIERIMNSSEHLHLVAYLEDSFGDYGLISFVILEKQGADSLFIDSWVMSCRVANRGLEKFLLNQIVAEAKKMDCRQLIGEYIPSKKNMPVVDHYKKMGFMEENGKWLLELDDFVPLETSIKAKEESLRE